MDGVRDAAKRGAQLVVLPELFRSRYFCQSEDAAQFDLAEAIPGPSTEVLGKLAAELKVTLVASLIPAASLLKSLADPKAPTSDLLCHAGTCGALIGLACYMRPSWLLWAPVAEGEYRLPALSPTGRVLAYFFCPGNFACDVWTIDLDPNLAPTGTPRRLTTEPGVAVGLTWAPDGRSVIYGTGFSYNFALWRVALDGTPPQALELTGERATHDDFGTGSGDDGLLPRNDPHPDDPLGLVANLYAGVVVDRFREEGLQGGFVEFGQRE
jgi:hypothetical protein